MDYQLLGRRIRAKRLQLGLTQEELAEKINMSASFVGHIERGTRIASIDTLVALCNTMDISLDYLLCDSLRNSYASTASQQLSNNPQLTLHQVIRTLESVAETWDGKEENK